jgi:hypothetical protein
MYTYLVRKPPKLVAMQRDDTQGTETAAAVA